MKFDKDKIYIHYVVGDDFKEHPFWEKSYDELLPLEKCIRKANIHTHGMEKFGKKNLCIGVSYDKEYAAYLLNNFAQIIVEEDDFNFNNVHYLDHWDDKKKEYIPDVYVRFKKVLNFGEECYAIIRVDEEEYAPIDISNVTKDWMDEMKEYDWEYDWE